MYAQVTFAALRFLCQQVALEGLVPADLARSGNPESLFSTGMRLYLRHNLFKIWDCKGKSIFSFNIKKDRILFLKRSKLLKRSIKLAFKCK